MIRAQPLAFLLAGTTLCTFACVQPLQDDGGVEAFEAGATPQPLDGTDGGRAPGDVDAGPPSDAGSTPAGHPLDDAGESNTDEHDAGDRDAGAEEIGADDAGAASADDAGANDAGQPAPEPEPAASGTFENPIVVETFPAFLSGDTTDAPSDSADAYTPCAPSTNESGGEFVYALVIPADLEPSILTATVDDVPGDSVDIDLHLLEAPDPTQCFARHNREVTVAADGGETLFLVADTWTTASGVTRAGPFNLSISLSPVSVESCFENPAPQCTDAPTPLTLPIAPPGVGNCPAGMTPAGTSCVDRYEASLVEVLGDGSLAPVSPFENPGNKVVRAVSAPNVIPQAYISGQQAAAACANAGKRLCREAEWERACRGSSGQTYPYGNTRQPGTCNDARTCHPAMQYFESSAQFVFDSLGHPCINQLPSSLDATGANPGCVSEDGAFDMMGNLHEWIADPSGVFRGGYYVDTYRNGDGCDYETTAHNFTYWDYSTGFRCCADPL